MAQLIKLDQASYSANSDLQRITMRRYACMTLTNLTWHLVTATIRCLQVVVLVHRCLLTLPGDLLFNFGKNKCGYSWNLSLAAFC